MVSSMSEKVKKYASCSGCITSVEESILSSGFWKKISESIRSILILSDLLIMSHICYNTE